MPGARYARAGLRPSRGAGLSAGRLPAPLLRVLARSYRKKNGVSLGKVDGAKGGTRTLTVLPTGS